MKHIYIPVIIILKTLLHQEDNRLYNTNTSFDIKMMTYFGNEADIKKQQQQTSQGNSRKTCLLSPIALLLALDTCNIFSNFCAYLIAGR